jgi:hypothetical protein
LQKHNNSRDSEMVAPPNGQIMQYRK